MPRQTKCPECGSSAVEEDSHYSQCHVVCTECGFLLTEGLLTTTRSEETFFQAVRYTESTAEVKKPCRNKIQGLKRVRDLCRILRVRPVVEDAASKLYPRAYDHPCFLHTALEKKEALVGCCVHVCCRQHNWPLTMGTVCALLHVETSLFSAVYLQLVKELHLDIPTLGLLDLVKTHCDGFNLFQSSESIPPKFLEDKNKVVDRATQLVELASETWLVTGRHPVPIITAAAYLAWQSLLPGHRLKCSLSRFCRLAGVRQPPPASKRVREIAGVLLRMAPQLAWLAAQRVDLKTVVKYTADILRHRNLLLRQALNGTWGENTGPQTELSEGMTSETSEEGGSEEGGNEERGSGAGGSEERGSGAGGSGVGGSEERGSGAGGSEERRRGSEERGSGAGGSGAGGSEERGSGAGGSEEGETKRSLQDQPRGAGEVEPRPKRPAPIFLPPCLTERKRRKFSPEPGGSLGTEPITGEEEISDSEIEQYLRTPEEVAVFRAASAIL